MAHMFMYDVPDSSPLFATVLDSELASLQQRLTALESERKQKPWSDEDLEVLPIRTTASQYKNVAEPAANRYRDHCNLSRIIEQHHPTLHPLPTHSPSPLLFTFTAGNQASA